MLCKSLNFLSDVSRLLKSDIQDNRKSIVNYKRMNRKIAQKGEFDKFDLEHMKCNSNMIESLRSDIERKCNYLKEVKEMIKGANASIE